MADALLPSDTKTRYGTHQQFFITSIEIDRFSLAHIQAEMQVSDEGLNMFNSDFLTIAYGLNVADELEIVGMLDMPEDNPEYIVIGVNRRYDRENSMGIYTYTYEALLEENTGVKSYELEFSMTQEPIETHPSFEDFEPIFGPYQPLTRTWPRVPTAKQTQAGGLSASAQASQAVTNPLFGVTSFLSPTCTFRVTYMASKVPASVSETIGTKDEPDDLREAFPDFADQLDNDKRDWLKIAPKFQKHGGAYTIIEEWMLSGPRGWDENLYSDKAIYGGKNSGDFFTGSGGSSGDGATRNTGPIF